MDKPDDGGPAFPHLNPNYDGNWDKFPQRGGMTLRDWFAGQALMGICAGLCSDHQTDKTPRAFNRLAFKDAAKDAYVIADVMIATRSDDGEEK